MLHHRHGQTADNNALQVGSPRQYAGADLGVVRLVRTNPPFTHETIILGVKLAWQH